MYIIWFFFAPPRVLLTACLIMDTDKKCGGPHLRQKMFAHLSGVTDEIYLPVIVKKTQKSEYLHTWMPPIRKENSYLLVSISVKLLVSWVSKMCRKVHCRVNSFIQISDLDCWDCTLVVASWSLSFYNHVNYSSAGASLLLPRPCQLTKPKCVTSFYNLD